MPLTLQTPREKKKTQVKPQQRNIISAPTITIIPFGITRIAALSNEIANLRFILLPFFLVSKNKSLNKVYEYSSLYFPFTKNCIEPSFMNLRVGVIKIKFCSFFFWFVGVIAVRFFG